MVSLHYVKSYGKLLLLFWFYTNKNAHKKILVLNAFNARKH